MISIALMFIAGMFNAIMDRTENESFRDSVFKNLNERFWYKRVSWAVAKKVFRFKLDAWHIAKHLMIVHICGAIVFYEPVFGRMIDFCLMGSAFVLAFNVFYNKILSAK